jgi:hypothetical protein
MLPRAVATIGVRIFALWVMLQGIFAAVIVASVAIRGVPTPRPVPAAATVLAPVTERVRDPVQTSAVIWSTLPSVAAHLGVSCVLLLCSRPIGRLLARNSE